jgi:Na+-translocating ferredoxin:NAD+ oxidoreductase RNF subunit RnfB
VAAASAGVSEGNGDVEQVEQLLPGARRCGGGGGSSYVESTATNVHMWQGWKNRARNGLVVLSW